ncbi:MAG: ATP-binding cassette domain-containing protein [Ktedonobacteraceae bacterium]
MTVSTTSNQQATTAITEQSAAIAVEGLVKRYPKAEVNAVDNISFSVGRGEIFGLLGPNGAGKTTTIGVLTTNVRPTSRNAHIMGINVATDPMSVKQRIAVVPQQSNLDRSLRAREILTFHASYHGVSRHEREARASTLLNELGLGDRGKEMVRRYSGGMAQRLMLARALMHAPDVLFLDEPTNSLDPQSRLFLWDRIRSLKEQGTTILLTTHDMEEADQLCERIAIMDKGRILVLDTANELKKLVPGGNMLELRVQVPQRFTTGNLKHEDQSPSPVLTALRAVPGATKVEEVSAPAGEERPHNMQNFRLYAEDASGLVVGAAQAILATGAELRDMHIARPSLEDVFIHLTGRNLR